MIWLLMSLELRLTRIILFLSQEELVSRRRVRSTILLLRLPLSKETTLLFSSSQSRRLLNQNSSRLMPIWRNSMPLPSAEVSISKRETTVESKERPSSPPPLRSEQMNHSWSHLFTLSHQASEKIAVVNEVWTVDTTLGSLNSHSWNLLSNINLIAISPEVTCQDRASLIIAHNQGKSRWVLSQPSKNCKQHGKFCKRYNAMFSLKL